MTLWYNISLYNNIPLNLTSESVGNRWDPIKRGTKIPMNKFINVVKLILDSTFFTFNGTTYKQKFGPPMARSPLSPIIVDLVMQDLKSNALENLDVEIPFYYRYVDDIALTVPRQKSNNVLETFNAFHSRMQFTMEMRGRKLNFLDVTMINKNNTLEFDWYHKPTSSGRLLNFLSHHPSSLQKRGVIMNMVDRLFLLSYPRFHQKNFDFIIETFVGNYPLHFIFDTIHTRLKSLFNKRTKKQNLDNINDDGRKG